MKAFQLICCAELSLRRSRHRVRPTLPSHGDRGHRRKGRSRGPTCSAASKSWSDGRVIFNSTDQACKSGSHRGTYSEKCAGYAQLRLRPRPRAPAQFMTPLGPGPHGRHRPHPTSLGWRGASRPGTRAHPRFGHCPDPVAVSSTPLVHRGGTPGAASYPPTPHPRGGLPRTQQIRRMASLAHRLEQTFAASRELVHTTSIIRPQTMPD